MNPSDAQLPASFNSNNVRLVTALANNDNPEDTLPRLVLSRSAIGDSEPIFFIGDNASLDIDATDAELQAAMAYCRRGPCVPAPSAPDATIITAGTATIAPPAGTTLPCMGVMIQVSVNSGGGSGATGNISIDRKNEFSATVMNEIIGLAANREGTYTCVLWFSNPRTDKSRNIAVADLVASTSPLTVTYTGSAVNATIQIYLLVSGRLGTSVCRDLLDLE